MEFGYRYWNARWNEAIVNSKWASSDDFAQEIPDCRCMINNGYVGFAGVSDGNWHIRNLRINADSSRVAFGPDACRESTALPSLPAPHGPPLAPLRAPAFDLRGRLFPAPPGAGTGRSQVIFVH